jgi:hypothetical protein
MIQLTSEAEKIRDEYLENVRAYVGMAREVDADEVLRDVNEHIDNELQNISQPVSRNDLEVILARLGSPKQWVSEEDISWWRQMLFHLRRGPEDWRLAYIAFATLIVGTALTGPVGLVASFCLARAAVSVSEKKELENKRWLIYPSLIIIYVLIAAALLFCPAIPLIGICVAIYDAFFEKAAAVTLSAGVIISIITTGMAIWWGVLWLLKKKYPRGVKALFRPFAENWKLNWLGYVSIVLFVIGFLAFATVCMQLQ